MLLRVVPLGFAQVSGPAAASNLPNINGAIPSNADLAVITVTGQNIMWRDDGTDPTTTVGNVLKTTDPSFEYTGDLAAFRMIQVAASAVVNVTYYKRVG